MEDPLYPQDDSKPDVMNDPQYATNTTDGDDGNGDTDTCRICRGEGGDSEPLFHPCKCSGSIKYVHQDCLMEWLSHSQKKHCELCKTPFRFTKLYSPNMPQSLPLYVLVRHIIIHAVKNFATWLRFCLVVMVWLGCLPFIIRQVWRLLFWFSDGGWPPNYLGLDITPNSAAMQALEMARELQLATVTGNGTSPVTPLHASQTTSASLGGIMDKLVRFLIPISQTLNISGADPLTAGLFKSLYYGFGIQSVIIPENSTLNASSSNYVSNIVRTSTLLSEVQFLSNLTRNSHLNRLVITIAEGYVITILVVVSFILVFLIREWVVQQQPGINMGAGFNAEFAVPERPREQPAVQEARRNGDVAAIDPPEPRDIGQRPIARPRRRNIHFGDIDEGLQRLPQNNAIHGQAGDPQARNRPSPVRDALSPAAEIQRRLTEEPRMTEEFLSIWRRADGDPQEVLRIIEREDKGDQMRYWVNSMKVLQSPIPQESGDRRSPESSPRAEPGESPNGSVPAGRGLVVSRSTDSIRAQAADSDKSSVSSESWIDIPKPFHLRELNVPIIDHTDAMIEIRDTEAEPVLNKGKGKAIGETEDQTAKYKPVEDDISSSTAGQPTSNVPPIFRPSMFSSSSSSSRPRAISDGPQPNQSISPLANNNWSFAALSDEGKQVDLKLPCERGDQKENGNTQFDPQVSASAALTSPEIEVRATQAWKAAQDVRVQQAVARGREARKTASQSDAPRTPIHSDSTGFDDEGPFEIQGQDGTVRTVQNWEEEFENNPVPESDSEDDDDEHLDDAEPNPFADDTPLPDAREPIVRPIEPLGLLGNVADFLWGGVGDDTQQDEPGVNDEHIVLDLAAEAPFVPVAHHDAFDQDADLPPQDREVVEAAIAAGLDPNDPDAIDDAEDFEGIMELVGMRGPIFSLLQNALFSAFLLALTVAFGVWIPYNIGRVSLLLVANPGPAFKLPLKLVFGCAALVQDMALSLLGVASYCLVTLSSLPIRIWAYWEPTASSNIAIRGANIGSAALQLSHGALERVMDGTISSLIHITDSEIFAFSAASHESLITLRSLVINTLTSIGSTVVYIFTENYKVTSARVLEMSAQSLQNAAHIIQAVPSVLAKPDTWVISLEVAKRSTPLDLELSVWGGTDRFWAIVAGYTALCFIGAIYVKKGAPFSAGQVGREWEATIIDLLNQAGGVMKVILIISIEMLVFPLYCGLLLDAALLPLFDNATIMSRLLFTFKSPLTSIFVHWFVGTCYMFHFALFVSMCRKIMRKGVLYFIRDPDDPTFHPVRDVLERNVATQLRKILFSALVYGALVVICLGGVVWGLSFAFRGVLPIHWSSNEPVLEFPIDLLFYNFLMPLAVRFFKPSDGLHSMYSWWFRQCARMLRLTWFMFDERNKDEEGYNVRRSWRDVFRGAKGDPEKIMENEDINAPFEEDPDLDVYFRHDGRYVRAPASDQVRIPKGTQIFLTVDAENNRVDGRWDSPDGVHGRTNTLYKHLYIPPWFRLRICVFILSIWIFAALTGVSITIVPLVFGRLVFAQIIPSHVRKNDVYAFSIGVYILGSTFYAAYHLRGFISYLKSTLAINADTPYNVLRRAASFATLGAKIAWTYTAFFFILPTLFAFLVEFYFIVPLHTYFATEERHVVHFVQSWTLGLLYVKLTTRIILWHADSRPAQSLRAIIRNGYFNPDAKLATRSFILPAGLVLSLALLWPWALARLATMTVLKENTELHVLAYRYAYPMCLALGCVGFAMYLLVELVKGWRMTIRDEVYLIGERLHNFGDRKSTAVGAPSLRRIDT